MNIFCHPGVFNGTTLNPAVANLLNIDPITQPCFGINPGVPLRNTKSGRANLPSTLGGCADPLADPLKDRTEIDLQLGTLFLEAKLTESNFQTAAPRLIERYRDLETVFDITRLPRKTLYTPASHPPVEEFSQIEEPEASLLKPHTTPVLSRTLVDGYQLIRNVLAAFASDASFCVLCDARRSDLIETWYSVLAAVHRPTFACRLKLLTWQELAAVLPTDLQQFLEAKYGILPA